MVTYTLRKGLLAIPLALLIVTVVFFLLRLIPGGPAMAVLGDRATAESIATFNREWGLDRPLLVQYADYMRDLLTGDLGRSYVNGSAIGPMIARAIPHSLLLTGAATLVSMLIGIPLGILTALRRDSLFDAAGRAFGLVGLSVPDFYFGILLILAFALSVHWLPMRGAGDWSDPASIVLRLIMPAITLGWASTAMIMRIGRSSLLEVLQNDYIRTARAQGHRERRVILKYALRNAMIPVLTVVGLNMGLILGNAIIIETVFSRPGLGKLLIGSVMSRDFSTMQSTLVVFALAITLINQMTDLTYALVDPRIRYE